MEILGCARSRINLLVVVSSVGIICLLSNFVGVNTSASAAPSKNRNFTILRSRRLREQPRKTS
jgi:hypothetical protein